MAHEKDDAAAVFEELNAERARNIDVVCDCFEHQLRTGGGPTIENLIGGFTEPDRTILLRELLPLEVERRVERGERPSRDEFLRRFPEHASIVREILREFLPDERPPTPAPNDLPPAIPKYQLLRKLSQGGMGAVYEALHTELGILVAIKLLRPNCTANMMAEVGFWREMKMVGTLTHPQIVQARDAGTTSGGVQYLVMEYLVGFDLARLVRRVPRLSAADACEIARRVALALDYAHAHRLVHRDIKPHNVLFGRSYGAQGDVEVKVVDFGLALLRGDLRREESGGGEVVGTFTFMAPEQYWEQSSDIRSDLYSLGCTLYFLLAGRPPFPRQDYPTVRQVMEAHRHAAPPDLQAQRPDVDPRLVELVERMLAKQADARPQSPREVVELLEKYAAGHDLNALWREAESRPEGPVEPVREAPPPCEPPSETRDWDLSRGLGPIALVDSPLAPPDASAATAVSAVFSKASDVAPSADASSPVAARRRLLAALVVSGATVAGWIGWQQFQKASKGDPIDLLARVDPGRDVVGEPWKREGAAITSPDAPRARLLLRHEVPAAYRLEVTARRRTGGRLVLGLVHDGRSFPVVLDSDRIAVGAGATPDAELTRRVAERVGFQPGKPRTFVAWVRPQGLLVAHEDRILFAVETWNSPAPALEEWRVPGYQGLFLGAHHSVYEFQRVMFYPGND